MESMTPKRWISLDAFRGFTVAAMIMVNFPGSSEYVFPTLKHSRWNGLSFTDLVAPFFLFIIGVSITITYKRYQDRSSKSGLYKKILWRSLKIFAIGMFLNAMPDFDMQNLRWTGTLHRIAIVFALAAIIFLQTNIRQQAWICAILLLGYWAAMTMIPTPGEGMVLLEPGRNLAAWVDSQYLPGRMWQGTWDPEGILSTIPSTATCMTGILAGHLIGSSMDPREKLNYLMVAGVSSAVAGYFMGLHFPVNENLWTSSFVLVTSGFAALVFGVLFFWVEIQRKQSWSSFGVIFGMNAITAYILGDLLALIFYSMPIAGASINEWAVEGMVQARIPPQLASLIFALLFVCINAVPLTILFRKKIFLKV